MSRTTSDIALADLPLRDELVGQEPYGAPQIDVPHALNVNENPYPPSPATIEDIARAVADASTGLNRYPDREAVALRTALAGYLNRAGYDLTLNEVWAANGSNEVMMHLLAAFAGPDRVVMSFPPTYSMYAEYARDSHSRYVTVPRREDFTIDLERTLQQIKLERPDVILLCSPNNPTGTSTDLGTIRAIHDACEGIVVADEAYREFARDGSRSAIELLGECPRLVVSRTMSKAFALAGGRLGYLVAAPAVVDACRIVRLPYHLSAVTQAVATTALGHADELLARVEDLRTERDNLALWLREQGLRVADSDANFVMFGQFADRHAVWQGLLDRGVLIREVGPEGWLRVSSGTAEEMAAFRTALAEVLGPREAPQARDDTRREGTR